MLISSSTASASEPSLSALHSSASTTSQTTTGPLPRHWRRHSSTASASGPSASRSTRAGVSIAIIGPPLAPGRRTGLAPADGGHRVAGVGEAVELEAPARARNRIVDTLAQDNAATLELDLQDGALAQAQRVAHRLGQRDLATFGPRRFHGEPTEHEVSKEFTYFKTHTQSVILCRFPAPPAQSEDGRVGKECDSTCDTRG